MSDGSASLRKSAAVRTSAPMRMSSGAPGRKVKPRAVSSSCRDETPRSIRMKSGWKAATAASVVGSKYAASRYRTRVSPSRRRLRAIASGSRSMPSSSIPDAEELAACPRHPGSRRRPGERPAAASTTGASNTGTWAGRSGWTWLGSEVKNATPRPLGNGVNQTGLTGLEPATSAVTVRHSNQAELQPPGGGNIER